MTMLWVGLLAVAFVGVGVLGDRLWIRFGTRTERPSPPENPVPSPLPPVCAADRILVELLQREWQTVVQTQMHFNDLVIRFRSMTLTAFAALVGAAVALGQLTNLPERDKIIVMALPIAFWIAAGILDLGYYHRLLLGAVAQAAKFDGEPALASLGLFGMTARITRTVRPFTTAVLVISYYLVPLAIVGSIIAWRVVTIGRTGTQ